LPPKLTPDGIKKREKKQRPCGRRQQPQHIRWRRQQPQHIRWRVENPAPDPFRFRFPCSPLLLSPLRGQARAMPRSTTSPHHVTTGHPHHPHPHRLPPPPPPSPPPSASAHNPNLNPVAAVAADRLGRLPHRAFGVIFGPCVLSLRFPTSRGEPGR
jgi:hypothetical protein